MCLKVWNNIVLASWQRQNVDEEQVAASAAIYTNTSCGGQNLSQDTNIPDNFDTTARSLGNPD